VAVLASGRLVEPERLGLGSRRAVGRCAVVGAVVGLIEVLDAAGAAVAGIEEGGGAVVGLVEGLDVAGEAGGGRGRDW
jgi:hypothetical protein